MVTVDSVPDSSLNPVSIDGKTTTDGKTMDAKAVAALAVTSSVGVSTITMTEETDREKNLRLKG